MKIIDEQRVCEISYWRLFKNKAKGSKVYKNKKNIYIFALATLSIIAILNIIDLITMTNINLKSSENGVPSVFSRVLKIVKYNDINNMHHYDNKIEELINNKAKNC